MNSLKSAMSELEVMTHYGDTVTDFAPTKKDLLDLANDLADELITYNFSFRFCVGTMDLDRQSYASYRLGRILDYLPELKPKIEEKLQRGYAKNDEDEPKMIERMNAQAQQGEEATKDEPSL